MTHRSNPLQVKAAAGMVHFVTAAVVIAAVVMAAAAVALVIVSVTPVEAIKARLDAMAPDGTADAFPVERIAGIVLKMRFAAALLVAVSAAVAVKRRQAGEVLAGIAADGAGVVSEALREVRHRLRTEEKSHLTALGVIFAAGAVLRFWHLGQPMRDDEAATFLEFASKPFLYGLSYYPAPNNHIFHTVLVHASSLVFGSAPWAIRLPAILAGLLLIPAVYCTARPFYNRYAALLAAAFVSVSPALVLYSTNARGYTIVCLLSLATLAAASRIAAARDRGAWIWLVLASILGLFTSPVMIYGLSVVMVWLALSGWAEHRRGVRANVVPEFVLAMAAVAIGTLLLYAPALVASGPSLVLRDGSLVPYPWSEFPSRLSEFAHDVWRQWNMGLALTLEWLCLAGCIASVLLHRRLARRRVPLILAAILGCAPLLVAQRSARYARVLLPLLPLYLILASAGISVVFLWLKKRSKMAASYLAVGVSVIFVVLPAGYVIRSQTVFRSNETGMFRDAERIASFLRGQLRDGDRVIPDGVSSYVLSYYFLRNRIPSDYLDSQDERLRRVFVVTQRDSEPAPGGSLILQRFADSTLYEVRPAP